MDFGKALAELKQGHKISREGWNGKNQYVVLAYMDKCVTSTGEELNDPTHDNIGSNFLLFVGSSGYQCGWLASQADILADDWKIL